MVTPKGTNLHSASNVSHRYRGAFHLYFIVFLKIWITKKVYILKGTVRRKVSVIPHRPQLQAWGHVAGHLLLRSCTKSLESALGSPFPARRATTTPAPWTCHYFPQARAANQGALPSQNRQVEIHYPAQYGIQPWDLPGLIQTTSPGQHRVATRTPSRSSTTPWVFHAANTSHADDPSQLLTSHEASVKRGQKAVSWKVLLCMWSLRRHRGYRADQDRFKTLEKCTRVFNTDMTSWPGATNNNARRGIARHERAQGAEERRPSHPLRTTTSGASSGIPQLPDTPDMPSSGTPAASFSAAVPGEIPMYKTTPNKPSLLKSHP